MDAVTEKGRESPHGVSAHLTYLIVSSLSRQQHLLAPILPEH